MLILSVFFCQPVVSLEQYKVDYPTSDVGADTIFPSSWIKSASSNHLTKWKSALLYGCGCNGKYTWLHQNIKVYGLRTSCCISVGDLAACPLLAADGGNSHIMSEGKTKGKDN